MRQPTRATLMTNQLRLASWIVGAASLALPATYFFVQQQALQRHAEARDGVACGLGALAAVMLSMLGAALLSAVASLLNGLALRKQVTDRSLARYVELLALMAPLVAVFITALVAAMA